jgi:hypothetical protein
VKSITACEFDVKCPLVLFSSNDQSQIPQLLQSFDKMNIEYIGTLDNDQYYVIITSDFVVHIYSINNLTQSLFQYNIQNKMFSFQTYHSNIIIFMFMNQFIFLQLTFDSLENIFKIHSEQILPIPKRELEYSLQFTPNKQFLILQQSLNLESDISLNDLHCFTCDNQFKISPIKDPITYIKSKMTNTGKITGFKTYTPSQTRSELWLPHQGTILHVRLPSNIAEMDIRADYHCWMRHSIALYQKTTEKSCLSVTITSLAVQSLNDSCIVSGGDDGSLVVWSLTDKYSHNVLESIHMDEVKN